MLVWNFGQSCLIYVSPIASYSDHYLFEKPMLAFVDLIHALPTRGRNMCIQFWLHLWRRILNSGRQLEFARICSGLAFMQGELVSPKLCFVLFFCADVVLPFLSSPRGIGDVSYLSRLCWAIALALGDRNLFIQDLILGFYLSFDHLFEIFGDYVCSHCTHQGGDWGLRASKGRWMVAP
jgi:hypothetical protein